VYPPTATFKGEHDGTGNLDKEIIRKAELNRSGRYPNTLDFMELLWDSPKQHPHALHDENRLLHELDEHNRIYVFDINSKSLGDETKWVNDLNNKSVGDKTNPRILITDKKTQNYDCTEVKGIQSSYCVIAFRDDNETGAIGTNQTVYLRDDFCSCFSCRGAFLPEHFLDCR
jgi:hypothetical protein